MPGGAESAKLQLTAQQYYIYEQGNGLFVASTSETKAQQISTPGYAYNRAVPPLLTPANQVLYSGNGLWLTDVFNGTAKQIAPLPTGQVITSLALSSDGSTVAWSTEPINGLGNVTLYAGPLGQATPMYTHDATDCPCFRVFSFLPQGTTSTTSDSMLLLTDDRGDHHVVQYGLWTLNLSDNAQATPQPLLDGNAPQGPLTLSSDGKRLLYSSYEGVVPVPSDNSVPLDVEGLNYANSMSIATVATHGSGAKTTVALNSSRIIVPEQHDLSNEAAYHWMMTPLFSPDGRTLVYIEFSADAQIPYTRHSALYTVSLTGTGNSPSVGKPRLLATTDEPYIELGTWLNNSVVTFYAENTLYALDVTSGATTRLLQPLTYARTVAVVNERKE
jgi:Tol biopolymer transport system component